MRNLYVYSWDFTSVYCISIDKCEIEIEPGNEEVGDESENGLRRSVCLRLRVGECGGATTKKIDHMRNLSTKIEK